MTDAAALLARLETMRASLLAAVDRGSDELSAMDAASARLRDVYVGRGAADFLARWDRTRERLAAWVEGCRQAGDVLDRRIEALRAFDQAEA